MKERLLLAKTGLLHRDPKNTESYVLRKKYSPRPMFYCSTLWDYHWTQNPKRATVFHSVDEIDRELNATWMSRHELFEVLVL